MPDVIRHQRRQSGYGNRRSWLKRVTAALVSGIALATAAPPALGQASCNQWHRCGMCGCRCSCLGGSDSACPSGTQEGGAWWACCFSSGRLWLVRSLDCCASSSAACPSDCWCSNACGSSWAGVNWCGGRGYPRCTRAVVEARC